VPNPKRTQRSKKDCQKKSDIAVRARQEELRDQQIPKRRFKKDSEISQRVYLRKLRRNQCFLLIIHLGRGQEAN
jgi:hypothetical protein